jgi:hypothetical protein
MPEPAVRIDCNPGKRGARDASGLGRRAMDREVDEGRARPRSAARDRRPIVRHRLVMQSGTMFVAARSTPARGQMGDGGESATLAPPPPTRSRPARETDEERHCGSQRLNLP